MPAGWHVERGDIPLPPRLLAEPTEERITGPKGIGDRLLCFVEWLLIGETFYQAADRMFPKPETAHTIDQSPSIPSQEFQKR